MQSPQALPTVEEQMKVLIEPGEILEIGIAEGEPDVLRVVYQVTPNSRDILVTAELAGNIKGQGLIYHQQDQF